jgi:hypothetical protein
MLPAGGLSLCLTHWELRGVSIAKAESGPDGKFFLKAMPGNYRLLVTDADKNILGEWRVRVGGKGVINGNFRL